MSKYTIEIRQDDMPEPPREWDNLGTMVCSHSRYNLGDEQLSYGEFWDFIKEEGGKDSFFILPLYLYDHSGLTMSTEPFSCPWDSGQVGYIYVSKDDVRNEFGAGRISTKLAKQAFKILKGEVETYDQYLRGDVYGYIIKDSNGVEQESCWGFYGEDYCRKEAEAVVCSLEKLDMKIRFGKLKALIQHHVPLDVRQEVLQ